VSQFKLAFIVFSALTLLATLKVAADDAPSWSYLITSNFRSEYVDEYGIVNTIHPVVQTEITITTPCGLYFDLWHSHNLTRPGDFNYNLGDEVDGSIGYSASLWKEKPYSLDIDLGVTYEDYVGLGSGKGDIILPYLELSHEFDLGKLTLAPYVRVEYALPATGNSNGDLSGSFAFVGVKADVELSSKWSFEEKLQLEADDGAFGYKPGGTLVDLTSTLTYKVDDHVSVDVEARLTRSLNDSIEKSSAAIVGVGVTCSF